MTATRTSPIEPGIQEWSVWTTTARIVTTDPGTSGPARQLVEQQLATIDAVASRFRPDSEVGRLAAAAPRPHRISPLLADLLAVALRAATDTDGAVDPTLGAQLARIGYDRDLDHRDGGRRYGTMHSHLRIRRLFDWRDVILEDQTLTMPRGMLLDLGATAKAWAADRCAQLVVERFGGGALVSLGGDLSVAGTAPDGGWIILVQDGPSEPSSLIRLDAARAVATSSTLGRTWTRGSRCMHHILDPRTGRPAPTRWRSVSVAASTCVAANVLTTAAVVRGDQAIPMLRAAGAPARLVGNDGAVVTLNGWPAS